MDQEYISYLREIILIASDIGLKIVICAHQDVWSRLSGGSGAPGWTFEVAGMDMRAFMQSRAAYVHNLDQRENLPGSDPREISGPFVWPSGYQKLAASTLATLFWAGDTFAWKLQVPHGDGTVPIQKLLQESFLNAFGKLADAVADVAGVIGFEAQNEPHRGLISLHSWDGWNYDTDLHIGHFPSLLQSCALGVGKKQRVPYYVRSWPWPTKVSHQSEVDPQGRSIWKENCLWRQHGAWDWDPKLDRPIVQREDFFTHDPRPEIAGGHPGRKVEWYRDFYAPFLARFSERVAQGKRFQTWFEPIPNEFHPPWPSTSTLEALDEKDKQTLQTAITTQRYAAQTVIETLRPSNIVFAPHFYDLNVLFNKIFNGYTSVDVQGLSRGMFLPRALFLLESGLRRNYTRQLSNIVKYARASLGELPIVIGEIGIPFDINGGANGNWTRHEQLLDALANGMEQAKVNGWCWWNYNPDNIPGPGDHWNKEDFSVVSRSGPRAVSPLVRPYAVRLAGLPMSSEFDRHVGSFSLRYANPAKPTSPSERVSNVIFLPTMHFAGDIEIEASDGEVEHHVQQQSLVWFPADSTSPGLLHTLQVRRVSTRGQLLRAKARQMGMQDWLAILAVGVAALSVVGSIDYFIQRFGSLTS